jgi:hypothetical protein
VDGTLVPTRDHRLAAPSKNNDTIVYRSSGIDKTLAGRPVMADGAYPGNPEVIILYRKVAVKGPQRLTRHRQDDRSCRLGTW